MYRIVIFNIRGYEYRIEYFVLIFVNTNTEYQIVHANFLISLYCKSLAIEKLKSNTLSNFLFPGCGKEDPLLLHPTNVFSQPPPVERGRIATII